MISTRYVVVISTVAAGIVAAVAGTRASAVEPPRESATCSTLCMDWGSCMGQHAAFSGYDMDESDHGPHWLCEEFVCCYRSEDPCAHWPCNESIALGAREIQQLKDAIEAGQLNRVAAIMRKHRDTIELNWERSSIQLVGCKDQIYGNFPIDTAGAAILYALVH